MGVAVPNPKDENDRPLQKSITVVLFCYATMYIVGLCVCCSAVELRIDRRCTLADLKTRLEEYVQVPSSEFKVSLPPSMNNVSYRRLGGPYLTSNTLSLKLC